MRLCGGSAALLLFASVPFVVIEIYRDRGGAESVAADVDIFSLLQLPGALSQSRVQRRTGVEGNVQLVQRLNKLNERSSWKVRFPNGYADADLHSFCVASLVAPAVCTFEGHPSEFGVPIVGVVATAEELSTALTAYPGAEVTQFTNTMEFSDVEVPVSASIDDFSHRGWAEDDLMGREATEASRIAGLESLVESNVALVARSVSAMGGQIKSPAPNFTANATQSQIDRQTDTTTPAVSTAQSAAPQTWQLMVSSWGPAGGIILIFAKVASLVSIVVIGIGSLLFGMVGSIFGFLFSSPYVMIAVCAVVIICFVHGAGGHRASLPVLALFFCVGFIVLVAVLLGQDPGAVVSEVGTTSNKALFGTLLFWAFAGTVVGWCVGKGVWACLGAVSGICIGLLNHIAHAWTNKQDNEGDYTGFGVYLMFVALSGYIYIHYLTYRTPQIQKRQVEGHRFEYGLFEGLKCEPNASICLLGFFFTPALWADTSVFGKMTNHTDEPPKRFWTHLLGFAVLSAMGFFSFGLGSALLLIWLVWNRQKIRRLYNLDYATPGTILEDSLAWLCCAPCATMQEAMQVTYVEQP